MLARQILVSASLVVVLGGTKAAADPAGPDPLPPPSGEAGSFQLGAGYNSDDGFLFETAVVQPSLFGSGDELALFAGITERRQLFLTRFLDPHVLGSELSLGADLYDDRRVLPGFTREAAGGTVTASTHLARHLRGFVGYRLEQVTADRSTDVLARGGPAGPPLAAGTISALRAGLEYTTLDTQLLPTRGTDVGLAVEYADPRLGSDLALATVHAWASTHHPIGPLILHLEGAATALASPTAIPLSERLFLDGSSDVRGFAPGAFGPLGPGGTQIGGDLKLTGRASLEAPLGHGLGIEGFVDYARLADGPNVTSGASAGFGLVWRSPIGPLRFDWAFPLGDPHPVFVFGFGAAW